MTNEERNKLFAKTERATEQIDLALGHEFDTDAFFAVQKILLNLAEELVHEAKAEVYEEAARVAEKNNETLSPTLPPEGYVDGYINACQKTADDIRALKDSLVPETVSSQ